MRILSLAAVAIISASGASFYTVSPAAAEGHPASHLMGNVSDATWGPAPPMLPPGAQIAVLAGDPTKAGGRYTVRLKFPANYTVPAHSHPEDENIVVVSGELYLQMGAEGDRGMATGLTPGGYGLTPAGAVHSAYTKTATTIVLYGEGPLDLKYVNPSDDPRTRTTTRK